MLDSRGGGRRGGGKKICTMQCINECLFLGLDDGQICVAHLNTGNSTFIKGHEAPVNEIILIDSIIVSACAEGLFLRISHSLIHLLQTANLGKINLWSFDASSGGFTSINTLLLNTPLKCLIEISTVHLNNEMRTLWTGGDNSVSIIDLKSLTLLSTLPQQNKVQRMLRYGVYILIGLSDGTINAYDLIGNHVFSSTINPISSMDAMKVNNEDLLLIGTKKGSLCVRKLPSFEGKHLNIYKISKLSKGFECYKLCGKYYYISYYVIYTTYYNFIITIFVSG